MAEASIACVLGSLLERSGNCDAMDLSELNALAAIIQRLLAGSQQIADLRRREEGPVAAECGCAGGLSEDALAQIEERLRLL
jgi:hypothetical protein